MEEPKGIVKLQAKRIKQLEEHLKFITKYLHDLEKSIFEERPKKQRLRERIHLILQEEWAIKEFNMHIPDEVAEEAKRCMIEEIKEVCGESMVDSFEELSVELIERIKAL